MLQTDKAVSFINLENYEKTQIFANTFGNNGFYVQFDQH